MRDIALRYSSLSGLFMDAVKPHPTPYPGGGIDLVAGGGTLTNWGGARFFGSDAPMPELQRTLLGGWPEGVARLREEIDHVTPPRVLSVRRARVWAAQGESVDMQRVYSGNIERAFRTTKKSKVTQNAHVRIVANLGGNWNRSAESLFYKGAAAVVLCESLAKAGYNVAIDAVHGAERLSPKQNAYLAFCAKPYHAPANLAALAASLCHPAMLRRVIISAVWSHLTVSPLEGMGRNLEDATLDVFRPVLHLTRGERLIFVPGNLFSRKAANEFIVDAVRALESGTDTIGGAA